MVKILRYCIVEEWSGGGEEKERQTLLHSTFIITSPPLPLQPLGHHHSPIEHHSNNISSLILVMFVFILHMFLPDPLPSFILNFLMCKLTNTPSHSVPSHHSLYPVPRPIIPAPSPHILTY